MNNAQQNINLDDIFQEKSLADIISKRDQLIIIMAQQIGELQKENEQLKAKTKEAEKAKKDEPLET